MSNPNNPVQQQNLFSSIFNDSYTSERINLGNDKKPKKKVNYLSKKKQRMEPSEVQKILNTVRKEKMTKRDHLSDWLDKKKKFTDEDKVGLWFEMGKLKSDTNRMDMPKELSDKKIVFYWSTFLELTAITSEKLYWEVILQQSMKASNISDSVDIKEITICSVDPITLTSKTNFHECYYIDNNVDICAPFSYYNLSANIADFGNVYTASPDQITIKDKTYTIYTNKNNKTELIIALSNYSVENIQKIMDERKNFLIDEKNELKQGIRTLEKKNGYYFYQKKFVPQYFCPSSLYLGSEKALKYSVLFEFELDKDMFLKKVLAGQQFFSFSGLMNFDNMINLINFYRYIGVAYIGSEIFKENIVNQANEYYETIKTEYVIVQKHFKNFCAVIKGYLDCFKTYVNFDKLVDLKKKVESYLIEDSFIKDNFKVNQNVLNLLIGLGKETTKNLQAYVNGDTHKLIEIMNSVLTKIINQTENAELFENEIRSIGLGCFNYLYDGNIPLVPIIRSRFAFLDIVNGRSDIVTLRNVLDKLSSNATEKRLTKEEAEKRRRKDISDIVDKIYVQMSKAPNRQNLSQSQNSMQVEQPNQNMISKDELIKNVMEEDLISNAETHYLND